MNMIAYNVYTLRTQQGLSKQRLADLSGLSFPTITKIEKGDENVAIWRVRAIADALGVTLCELDAPSEGCLPESVVRRIEKSEDLANGLVDAYIGLVRSYLQVIEDNAVYKERLREPAYRKTH